MSFAFDVSRDYDPSPQLGAIKAPLLTINSADDQVNPPELGILERAVSRVPDGRAVVLPITDQTRGHGTHSLPAIRGSCLVELLRQTTYERLSCGLAASALAADSQGVRVQRWHRGVPL